MNEVPLIQNVQKNDINTSIIAIKKQLKELNAMLGLIDTSSNLPDMSPYIKKTDVTNEVQRFNLNPVTSNAVYEAIIKSIELDWTNAESVTLSTRDYIVKKNGWLVGYVTGNDNVNAYVKVNDVTIARTDFVRNAYINSADFQIMVKKGDVVKTTGALLSQTVNLVPYKYFNN